MTVAWLAEHRVDGEIQVRIGRDGERCIAEYPGLGALFVMANGEDEHFEYTPGLPLEWQEKLRNGLFGGMLWHAKGGFALHGSAVQIGSRAVVLFGDSCAGKSSVAAELVRSFGAKLLADDATVLQVDDAGVYVRHTESRSWLRPAVADHFGMAPSPLGKVPFGPRFEPGEGITLSHLIHLSFDAHAPPGGRLVTLRGFEALQRLLPHVIRLVLSDPARERVELNQIQRILGEAVVCALVRPRTMEELQPTCASVVALLA